MTDYTAIRDFISRFPIYQYAFVEASDISFDPSQRAVCKRDCPKYDTNWGCPPAIAKADKCRERCLEYTDALIFSTFAQAGIPPKPGERAASLADHEKLTELIETHLKDVGYVTYTLSSDACQLCPKCTFPFEACRHQDRMHPCIESHGIVIRELAEECCMDYDLGEKLYLWFSIIFFRDIPLPEINV